MGWGIEIAQWALLSIAALCDLKWGKIPNRLTFAFIFFGLLVQTVQSGATGLGRSAFAIGAAFILYFPLFVMRALAAGDVKCLMAFAAWSDAMVTVRIGIISILVGAVVGLWVLLTSRGLIPAISSIKEHWTSLKRPAEGLRIPTPRRFSARFS